MANGFTLPDNLNKSHQWLLSVRFAGSSLDRKLRFVIKIRFGDLLERDASAPNSLSLAGVTSSDSGED